MKSHGARAGRDPKRPSSPAFSALRQDQLFELFWHISNGLQQYLWKAVDN